MAWVDAVVTNEGVAMLHQVLAGETLTLDGAACGTGTVSAAALMAQTALKDQKQTCTIVGAINVTGGKKINILITSVGLATGFPMQQVGIWAHVGSGASKLFAILQDNTGIPIPSSTEIPDFAMNFYAVVKFSNESNFALTVDSSALVSISMLNGAITERIGIAGGLAGLDENAKVPTTHIPDLSILGYLKKVAADVLYSALGHIHSFADITNKPTSYPPSSHSHVAGDLPSASTVGKGVVQLSSSVTGSDTSKGANELAVRDAYNRGSLGVTNAAAADAKIDRTINNTLTGGTAPAYTLTNAGLTGYLDKPFLVRFHAAAATGAATTLNVNGVGAFALFASENKYFIPKKDDFKWVVLVNGIGFFVCSAGGGIDLPSSIAGGDTAVRTIIGRLSAAYSNTYAPTGRTWTAPKTGVYRIFYDGAPTGLNPTQGAVALFKNGAYALNTEVSITSNASVIGGIDLSLTAGDVITVQIKSLGVGYSYETTFFVVAILWAELATAVATIA